MRPFAQTPKATQQSTSAKPATLGRSHFGQRHESQAVSRLREDSNNSSYDFDFSRIPVHPHAEIRPKLTSITPRDSSEKDADRTAEQIMDLPARQSSRQELESSPAIEGRDQPLPSQDRAFFERRFGHDFSQVRIHADNRSAEMADALNAEAFTFGRDLYFGAGTLRPRTVESNRLLSHELAHVVQQRTRGRRFVQPRLLATGDLADIERFIALAEPAMGEDLEWDPATNEITAVASLATPATSPAFAAAMHRIIDDPAQDAEAHFGEAQPLVAVGAFPQPSDMTGPTEQQIDMDDVENIEAGAPGNGLGKLAHELTENYTAHAAVAVAGVDQFPAAHDAGVSAESDVAEDTVGPGRRVADVDTAAVGNTFTRVQDFENYYLVFDLTRDPATNDFSVSNARQAPRVNVGTYPIDNFATGSAVLPAGAAAQIAAAAADVAANDSATVRVEGFTDSVGSTVGNIVLGSDRADAVQAALVAAGVAAGRIHSVGLGESQFVAPNDTDANRALNRRVVIIVDRPGP